MPTARQVKDAEFKDGDSVFFSTPIIISGGSSIYRHRVKAEPVMAQLKNGLLSFAEYDVELERRPQIELDKIRADQIVFV